MGGNYADDDKRQCKPTLASVFWRLFMAKCRFGDRQATAERGNERRNVSGSEMTVPPEKRV